MKKPKSKKTKIFLSITALLEVVILAVGVTFSWIEGGNNATVEGTELTINAGSTITMLDSNNETQTAISLNGCNLDEASSSDGRNFYFPLADNTSSDTTEMTFREGTSADVNQKYLSYDFKLVGGETASNIYLTSGTLITCDETLRSALRVAFYTNDGSDPIVFKPTQLAGNSSTYSPITAIDTSTGSATQTDTSTDAFGEYYYVGDSSTPLFELAANETKRITLTVWLEGTAFEGSDGDDIANQDIDITIGLTNTGDSLTKYNFVDNTHSYTTALSEYWIKNTEAGSDGNTYSTMMYVYDTANNAYYVMSQSDDYDNDHTWSAYIPNSVTSFSFRRYNPGAGTNGTWWNEWNTDGASPTATDSNGEYTYVAICGTQTGDTGTGKTNCGGYWKDSDSTFRVYFENSVGWSGTIYCYAWRNDAGSPDVTAAWPGDKMTSTGITGDSNKTIYYCDIKGDDVVGIKFNNNSSETGNITNSDYFFNGFAYWYESSTSSGVYLYTNTTCSLIFS